MEEKKVGDHDEQVGVSIMKSGEWCGAVMMAPKLGLQPWDLRWVGVVESDGLYLPRAYIE